MNKIQKGNQFTFIVQAVRRDMRCLKPHYFRSYSEAITFFKEYIVILEKDNTINSCGVSSKYSVNTVWPDVAFWYNK